MKITINTLLRWMSFFSIHTVDIDKID